MILATCTDPAHEVSNRYRHSPSGLDAEEIRLYPARWNVPPHVSPKHACIRIVAENPSICNGFVVFPTVNSGGVSTFHLEDSSILPPKSRRRYMPAPRPWSWCG